MLRKESKEIIDNLINNMNGEERVYTYTQALRKRSAENCAIVESLGPKAVAAFVAGYEHATSQIRKESAGVLGQKAAKFVSGQVGALKGLGRGITGLGRAVRGTDAASSYMSKSNLLGSYGKGIASNLKSAAPTLVAGAGGAYGTARLANILSAANAE